MTSPGFCSISVSILVRRFLLPGSHSSSPGVSMLFLLLRNSPGISFQLSPHPRPPLPFISYTAVLSFPFPLLLLSFLSFFLNIIFSHPLQKQPFCPKTGFPNSFFVAGTMPTLLLMGISRCWDAPGQLIPKVRGQAGEQVPWWHQAGFVL